MAEQNLAFLFASIDVKIQRMKILSFSVKKGFTLVELMVTVAIIGILAAVGIPSFKKYQAKTKTSEAKIQLAALYSVETSFQSEYDVYYNCLPVMGYNPSTEISNRWYSVGIVNFLGLPTGLPAACDGPSNVNNTTNCSCGSGGDYSHFHPGRTLNAGVTDTKEYDPYAAVLDISRVADDYSTFLAAAAGYISPSNSVTSVLGGFDRWTIDEKKNLVHESTGY